MFEDTSRNFVCTPVQHMTAVPIWYIDIQIRMAGPQSNHFFTPICIRCGAPKNGSGPNYDLISAI